MGLDFNKELERILGEKKNMSQKQIYENDRLRRKEDLELCQVLNRVLTKKISSIYDLMNYSSKYKNDTDIFIPILIDFIEKQKINNDSIKEGVIRALIIKESKGKVEKTLLKAYKRLPNNKKDYLGWVIGSAIDYLYSDQYFDSIIQIVNNENNGMSRQMFILALAKSKKHKEQVEDLLLNLMNDEDIVLHVIQALTKLKSIKAKKQMIRLSTSSNKVVKRKALSFLKKADSWEC